MHFSAPSGNPEAEVAAVPVSPGTTDRDEEEVKGRKSRETKLGMLLAIVREGKDGLAGLETGWIGVCFGG